MAVLAYALAVAFVPSTTTSWDGLGFLLNARPPLDLDYGHALYVPALRAVDALLGGALGSAERAAKLLSALGAALAFWLLWRRAARSVPRGPAGLAAALFATTPFFLREAGVVEPSTWTIVALLGAAHAAEAYARRRSVPRLAVLIGAALVAGGFHLVSGCALVWWALSARGPERIPRRHVAGVLGAALLLALVAAPRLPAFWAYWMSFVTGYEDGFLATLASNARRAAGLFVDGTPVLALCAAVGAGYLGRVRRTALVGPLALGVPYLLAFLFLGRPLIALLLPVTLAFGLCVTAALAEALRGASPPRWVTLGLPLAVVVQLATAVPHVRAWTSHADPDRDAALWFASTLPERAILLAGPAANHVRYYTDAPVVAVPNLLQAAVAEDPGADPIAVLRDEVRRQRERGVASYLTGEAVLYLRRVWGADALRLAIDEHGALPRADDPALSLLPIRGEGPPGGG